MKAFYVFITLILLSSGWRIGYSETLSADMVSMINLIASPEKYHQKHIYVQGFVVFGSEGNAIYLSKDDYLLGNIANAFSLKLKCKKEPKILSDFSETNVFVSGNFNMMYKDNLFNGSIDVDSLSVIEKSPNEDKRNDSELIIDCTFIK